MAVSSYLSGRPTWFYGGWRGWVATAPASCGVPTSRAVWKRCPIFSAAARRSGLQAWCGTASSRTPKSRVRRRWCQWPGTRTGSPRAGEGGYHPPWAQRLSMGGGAVFSWILGPGWAGGQLRMGLADETCQQGQSKWFLLWIVDRDLWIIHFSLSFIFSKILFDSIKSLSFLNLFLWMAVNPEAEVFRWRPSGLCSSSSFLPHSAFFLPWTPGGDLWRDSFDLTPRGHSFDLFSTRKEALRMVAVRKHGSLRTSLSFLLDIIEFVGPCLFLLPVSLPRVPCRPVHALKIPIVSLSAWVVFLTKGMFLRDLCLFTYWVSTLCQSQSICN